MDTVRDLLIRLNRHMDYNAAWYRKLDAYYHGRQPLGLLPEKVREDVGDRLPAMRINWARMVVDSIEERLDVEGFRLGDDSIDSDLLWMIWQANGMDEQSQLAHLEALIHGRSYVMIWAGPDGFPRITAESGRQTVVWNMPGSRHRIAALKRWVEPDGHALATLFQPHQITKWRSPSKITIDPYLTEAQLFMSHSGHDPYAWWDWSQIPATNWELRAEPIPNPLGVVPIVPLTNRPRLLNWGESEITDVLPLLEAVNKLATDLLVASEYFAMPRRWVTGIEITTDAEGNAVDPFSKQHGRNWLAESESTKFGQFPEAQLDNFVGAITVLTEQLGAIAGLPKHYLGLGTEPGSADAIRSSEAPLVEKARRRQRQFGGTWEEILRLAVIILDGYVRPGLHSMEAVWGDPETRTIAQQADAATKLHQIGIPRDQLMEDLQYSPQEISRVGKLAPEEPSPNGAGQLPPDDVVTQREIRGDVERAR